MNKLPYDVVPKWLALWCENRDEVSDHQRDRGNKVRKHSIRTAVSLQTTSVSWDILNMVLSNNEINSSLNQLINSSLFVPRFNQTMNKCWGTFFVLPSGLKSWCSSVLVLPWLAQMAHLPGCDNHCQSSCCMFFEAHSVSVQFIACCICFFANDACTHWSMIPVAWSLVMHFCLWVLRMFCSCHHGKWLRKKSCCKTAVQTEHSIGNGSKKASLMMILVMNVRNNMEVGSNSVNVGGSVDNSF